MEIDWLEDFLALSSAGIFARAADARNISQSAFTRRIKNLEHWAGTPLFDRSVHPVQLTPAGEAFKKTAFDTVNALKESKHDIRGLTQREADRLDFVALHTLAISFFPAWLSEMSEYLGPIKSRLVAENFSGCAEAILTGSADFMLCYAHPTVPTISDESRYPSAVISTDRIIAVSACDSTGTPTFDLTASGDVPFLTYPPDTFLGRITQVCIDRCQIQQTLNPVYENSVAEALKSACLEGHGLAFLPESSVKTELADGKLVKVSQADFEANISIRLYRSIERSRPQLERFWKLSQRDG
ncbi:LysR substrate-binding domain-containing protein [Ruegeria sp. 2205SS24-7]|uniref:LysR substrate-binding domain-containing protein n=1 Tax=Ruegeria discodermiae TaxID=3064389 RepID=UPI0027417A7A|nr:LysR substrate-binding domain-containing protein [Ruegeria sp. 2205SS24-7]MDP5218494.1 LysR substrate-binding domain-containing protein [Ruegeria sp. 2205SS24-7]